MTSKFNLCRSFALFAFLAVVAMVTGCDSFSGMVPTSDTTNTESAEAPQAASSTNGPPTGNANGGMEMAGQMPGPGGMEMPGSDGVEMAEMMMGEGQLAVPDGGPDGFDTASDPAGQLGSTIPDDGAPDAVAGTDEYFNRPGGIGLDPAVGDGTPGDLGAANQEYLNSFGVGGEGPAAVPGGPDQSPGQPGQRPRGNASGKPAPAANPSAIGTKLRNKNGAPAQASRPAPPRTGSAPKAASGGNSPAPSFTQQPLFRLSNPVCLFDGTGFSISFSVDYQLLRAPEPGVSYLWVVSFEELDKSGQGSSIRKVQQSFKPTDSSSTLRVIVPLKGQPKEPYRCVIAAKKGNQLKQVSKSTTFPPTFK